MKAVKGFTGEYEFLSNFYFSPFSSAFDVFDTVEHCYQSQKCCFTLDKIFNPEQFIEIANAPTPSDAKKLGRKVDLDVSKWDAHKDGIMRIALRAKFDQNPELRERLIATSPAYLEETNWWKDRYWGVDGYGLNVLGCMLMELRGYYIYGGNK